MLSLIPYPLNAETFAANNDCVAPNISISL